MVLCQKTFIQTHTKFHHFHDNEVFHISNRFHVITLKSIITCKNGDTCDILSFSIVIFFTKNIQTVISTKLVQHLKIYNFDQEQFWCKFFEILLFNGHHCVKNAQIVRRLPPYSYNFFILAKYKSCLYKSCSARKSPPFW